MPQLLRCKANTIAGTPVSNDSLFFGKLSCQQYLAGYRFSIDAVLLAHFIAPRSQEKILDLGAGCGVISLVLAYRWPDVQLSCLEIQPSLAALIDHNVAVNHFGERFRVTAGDLRQLARYYQAGSFDWVICNPPFYKNGTGRSNLQAEQALARHELAAELSDVLAATSYALKTRGRVALVYPVERLVPLLSGLRANRLEPKRLRVVYSYPGSAGRLVLIEAVKGGGEELTVLPALYIYQQKGGAYTEEVAGFYECT